MTNNEDKREFEFIEHPVSPNKHNSSCSSSTIVKMWVLLEGTPDPEELKADITHVKNLNDFKDVLISEFDDVLGEIKKRNIVLLNNDNTPLRPSTNLQTLVTTDEKPLIVRYPISSANLKIYFKFGNHKLYDCEIPHNSGSFNLLKEAVIEKHSELKRGNLYFVYEVVKGEERQIQNQYNLNTLISECKLDGNNYVISKLKVVEKGKKSFSSWNIKEAHSEILQRDYSSLSDFLNLDMTTFTPLEREFSEEKLKFFVDQLHQFLEIFNQEVNENEGTCRTYINVFIAVAASHVKDIKKNSRLHVNLESMLNGTYGSGPLDYMVKLGDIVILIIEAKAEDMKQGIAQAIVQLYTLMEKLFRKFRKPTAYGIVTTGTSWRFIRWTGSSLNKPVIHMTTEFRCKLDINDDDMKNEKEILKYIAQLLQVQVDNYKDSVDTYEDSDDEDSDDEDSERSSKRTKI